MKLFIFYSKRFHWNYFMAVADSEDNAWSAFAEKISKVENVHWSVENVKGVSKLLLTLALPSAGKIALIEAEEETPVTAS